MVDGHKKEHVFKQKSNFQRIQTCKKMFAQKGIMSLKLIGRT